MRHAWLVVLILSADVGIRAEAIRALGAMGPAAAAAAPALTPLTADENAAISQAAKDALAAIQLPAAGKRR